MDHIKDVEYIALIYVGTPDSMPARVVYDTGSSWLTVKACITKANCHMSEQEVKSNGHTVMDPKTHKPKKMKGYDVAYYTN